MGAAVGVAGEGFTDEESDEGFVHRIFREAPQEDSGSDTLGNYRYQAEVAAQMCIALVTQDFVESVVCEWHEDLVVSYADGSVELVSVKHRGKRRAPWNVADLCKNGGLAHLFDRWRACDGLSNVRLRLATNAGLTSGKGGAATLKAMCGADPEITTGLDAMASTVAQHLLKVRWKQHYATIPEVPEVARLGDIAVPAGFTDTVKLFFAVLHIDDELPSRQHITDVNLQSLLIPAIATLQRDHVDVEATYRALVERIEKSNRDERDRGQLAVYLADPTRVFHSVQIQQRIARRRLTRAIVLDTFVSSRAAVPTFARGQLPIVAPGGGNLRKKMARGRIPADEAAHAERLRSAWYVTWSAHRSGLAGDTTELANASFEVLDTVFVCREQAEGELSDGAPYGLRMNQLMTRHLTPDALGGGLTIPVNGQHLRGLAYQLCDDCDFYFSDWFDLSDEEAL
ncbi:dsDNA nuclease domain-containing protein [Streptomyces sp. NPDC060030]|uniref:dsDNA nuclease domain-containing protein n=1 Tax=Streptomyces sp. NPDC060030 TaxID=3347042 RepID=UPI0036CD6CB4